MAKRTVLEIDLKALEHNLDEMIKKAKGKEVIAVVKADAYGFGVKEAIKAFGKANSYAVATTYEATELRSYGIKKDILVLAPIPYEDIAVCIENDITLTISDVALANEISKEAKKQGKKAKLHAAIDTGLNRIGFEPNEESADELLYINNLEGIFLEAIFSHFAKADCKDKTSMNSQKDIFKKFYEITKNKGLSLKAHIANSAGIIEEDTQFGDMVRAGIVLYGYYPSDEVKKELVTLKRAADWKSRVSFVKDLDEGEGVSYGLTFTAKEKMRIATVSVGYADGYPRLLSGKGRVLINGKSCPILGRVCMDQFMVDVTGIDAKIDDEVILIGKSGDEEITADEIAALTGTISYEVCCDISKRVPRIYK